MDQINIKIIGWTIAIVIMNVCKKGGFQGRMIIRIYEFCLPNDRELDHESYFDAVEM